jgi:putative flippase GtrA
MGRVIRFGLVGILATSVYAVATFVAVEFFYFTPVIGALLGQATSALVSYFGHAMYSFRVDLDHRTFLWRFFLIGIVTVGINVGTTWVLTEAIGFSYRIAIVVVTVLIPVTNYLCNRYWVFLPGLAQSPLPAKSDPQPSRREVGRT